MELDLSGSHESCETPILPNTARTATWPNTTRNTNTSPFSIPLRQASLTRRSRAALTSAGSRSCRSARSARARSVGGSAHSRSRSAELTAPHALVNPGPHKIAPSVRRPSSILFAPALAPVLAPVRAPAIHTSQSRRPAPSAPSPAGHTQPVERITNVRARPSVHPSVPSAPTPARVLNGCAGDRSLRSVRRPCIL